MRRRMGQGLAVLMMMALGWLCPAAALGQGSVVISAEPENFTEIRTDPDIGVLAYHGVGNSLDGVRQTIDAEARYAKPIIISDDGSLWSMEHPENMFSVLQLTMQHGQHFEHLDLDMMREEEKGTPIWGSQDFPARSLQHLQYLSRLSRSLPYPGTLTCSGNKLYWNGQEIHLVGFSSYETVGTPLTDIPGYLDVLASYGINFTRMWCVDHNANDGCSHMPFRLVSGDGCWGSKFDISRPDDAAYLARLREFVTQAWRRGIVVQLCLLDRCSLNSSRADSWPHTPYNAANNINGLFTLEGAEYPPAFTNTTGAAAEIHRALLKQIVATVGDCGNVIYEIFNEPLGCFPNIPGFHHWAAEVLRGAFGETRASSVEAGWAGGWLRLTAVAPDVVRVQIGPSGVQRNDHPAWWTEQPRDTVPATIKKADKTIDFSLPRVRVRVTTEPLRLEFLDNQGRLLTASTKDRAVELRAGAVRANYVAQPDEHFFGFGLQFNNLDFRGKKCVVRIADSPSAGNGMSHAVVPYFTSTQGYGLLLNSIGYSTFNMADQDPQVYSFEAPEKVLDYYVLAGQTPKELLDAYTRLTGRPALPPKWGLGFRYLMRLPWKADQIMATATEFRRREIPCDVVGLEDAWQTHAYPCSYVWNKETIPDPPAFIKWMSDRGFRVQLWEHAWVHASSPLYQELQQANCVADKNAANGLAPDFTLPAAREIFCRFHENEHVRLGVCGYKLDECDGQPADGGWGFPDDTVFPGGLRGAQMHNLFGYLYQQMYQEMFRRLNRRTYTLVRANFVGAQAYASCIFSDYFDFKGYIRALCTSGFTGVLWCPEVRKDSIDSQEFIRRSQVTFFAPMAMINAWHDAQVPWEWGDEAEAIFKKYDHLRMRLLPYVYAQFRQAGKTGVPLVRGLVVDFPEDKETYAIDDQFMFGDALMVAPVIRGESRKVHFPPGTWTDFWTGEKTAGGCTKEVKAPLDTLPLYVRDGAIIPMGPVMSHVAEREVTDLEIHLYPGPQPRRLTLYDDDGVTFDYEKGSYWEVPIELAADGQGISAKLLPPIGSYRSPIRTLDLVCHDGKEPPPRKQLDTSALAKKAQTIRFDR